MTEDDDGPFIEQGPPTPEEAEAIRAIIRDAGGLELPDDAEIIVRRVYTAEDLRAEAEAAAEHFTRPPAGDC